MPRKTNAFQRRLDQTHAYILAWYSAHGRHHLPWRNTRDAYAIWISEIMLQQTQVATVLSRYYSPFLERFPTLKKLANASGKEVLKAWEGLGYYRRATHLHRAAKQAMGCYGSMPTSVEGLLALPGIGRNTAHAIASFAYNIPVPVMEANVKRVLSRVMAEKQPTETLLWEKADELLNHAQPFEHNQAMMDIGSLLCTPCNPSCDICPLSEICMGKNTPESYPAKKEKAAPPIRRKRILVLQDIEGKLLFIQRTGAFLSGLYGFLEADDDAATVTFNRKRFAFSQAILRGQITQTYSHFKLEASVYTHTSSSLPHPGALAMWQAPNALPLPPISGAERKILSLLTAEIT